MVENALTELDPPKRIRKRAQYEAFTFSRLDRDVLVRNESYADPENHAYPCRSKTGFRQPMSPADTNYSEACKHRVAVAIRRPILAVATQVQVVSDCRDRSQTDVEDKSKPEATGCEHLSEEFPCWECVRTGRRALPRQE